MFRTRNDGKPTKPGSLSAKSCLRSWTCRRTSTLCRETSTIRHSGLKHWEYASIEALQRIVAMTAIQFVLFEPVGHVKGNDEFNAAADKMIEIIIAQPKTAASESALSSMGTTSLHVGHSRQEDGIRLMVMVRLENEFVPRLVRFSGSRRLAELHEIVQRLLGVGRLQ